MAPASTGATWRAFEYSRSYHDEDKARADLELEWRKARDEKLAKADAGEPAASSTRPAPAEPDDLSDLIVDVVTTDDRPWWPLLSLMELMDHEAGQLPPRRRKIRQAALGRIREDLLFDRSQLAYALAAAVERRLAADAITSGHRP